MGLGNGRLIVPAMRFPSFGAWRSPATILTPIVAGVILLVLPIEKVGTVPIHAATVTSMDTAGMVRIEGASLASNPKIPKAVWLAAERIAEAPARRDEYLQKAMSNYEREYDESFLPDVPPHEAALARRAAQVNILNVLTTMGRYAQADSRARVAWLNDPGNPGIAAYVGLFALMRGKPNEAIPVLVDGYNSLGYFAGRVQFEGPLLAYLGEAYELKEDCPAANALYRMAATVDADIKFSQCKETP